MPISLSHPELVLKWHPTKNVGLNIDDYTHGSQKEVWWFCPKTCPEGCPHEWFCSFNNMTGQGKIKNCPKCVHNPPSCEHEYIHYTHKDIVKEWHPSKNGNLKPSNYLSSARDIVWWLCPKTTCIHGCIHEYQASISSKCRLKSGCPICAGQKVGCEHQSILHTRPELAKQWHPTKNLPLLVTEIMAGSSKPIWWRCGKTCPEGCPHEWQAAPSTRKTNGCPCCSRKGDGKYDCVHMHLSYTHPALVTEWDSDLNNGLKPCDFKSGSNKVIVWKCLFGHKWSVKIKSRTCFGTGCPSCKNKTEKLVWDYLHRRFPSLIRQFKIKGCVNILPLPFDFCIPDLKTIIEIDGRQHFVQVSKWQTPEATLVRDIFKMNKAYEAGYKVIRIFQEDVYKYGEAWLDKNLLPELNNDGVNALFLSSDTTMYDNHITLFESNVLVTPTLDNNEEFTEPTPSPTAA
jgi:very-short-patch-repair endonuclease